MKRGKLTEEEVCRIVELYNNGAPVKVICSTIGCTRNCINTYVRRAGCKPRNRSLADKITDEQKQELLDRYAAGEPVEDLAARFGLTIHAVYHMACNAKQKRFVMAKRRREYVPGRKIGKKNGPVQIRKAYQREHSAWYKSNK